MEDIKQQYIFDYDKYKRELNVELNQEKEKNKTAAQNIRDSELLFSREEILGFENKAKQESEKLITFKSDLKMTEISKDRDLCIEALKQDIRIDREIVSTKNKIVDNKRKIIECNIQPTIIVPNFETKKEPEEPYKPTYYKKTVNDFYSFKANWWITSIGVILAFLTALAIGVGIVYLLTIFWIDDYQLIRLLISAGIAFVLIVFIDAESRLATIVKIYASIFILFILICIAISNAKGRKRQKLIYNEAINLYKQKCLDVQRENYENFIDYTNKIEIERKKIKLLWDDEKEQRELETIRLKTENEYFEIFLEYLDKLQVVASKNFICPYKYNKLKVKEKLLSLLEDYIAYTLADAIQYYEKLERERVNVEEERAFRASQIELMEEQVKIRQKMAKQQGEAIEKERIANEKHRMEQMQRLSDMNKVISNLEKQNKEIKDSQKEIKDNQEKLKENQEKLKETSNYSSSLYSLSSSEISDIAYEVAKNLDN